jgi:hypothetical protein
MGMDLAGSGYHINRSNLLILESKTDMQKRGHASPDDGDALALSFAAKPATSGVLAITALPTIDLDFRAMVRNTEVLAPHPAAGGVSGLK